MNKILCFVCIWLLSSQIITAQTNTYPFPSTGSIGIGTTVPNERLTVLDNGDAQGLGLYRNYSGSTGAGTYFNFGALDGSYNRTIGSALFGVLNANKTSGELHFHTATGSALVNRMSIDQYGNVGIGTFGGSLARLEVNGNIFTNAKTGYIQFGTDNSKASYVSGDSSGNMIFGNHNTAKVIIKHDSVGIGTISPTEKLSVEGNISAKGFIKAKKIVVTQDGWSDYVFAKNYKLRSLSSLELFIKQNKHLPEVPSAKEVEEKGINVGDNQALLLKKIEELTLYLIEQDKKIERIIKENQELKRTIKSKK